MTLLSKSEYPRAIACFTPWSHPRHPEAQVAKPPRGCVTQPPRARHSQPGYRIVLEALGWVGPHGATWARQKCVKWGLSRRDRSTWTATSNRFTSWASEELAQFHIIAAQTTTSTRSAEIKKKTVGTLYQAKLVLSICQYYPSAVRSRPWWRTIWQRFLEKGISDRWNCTSHYCVEYSGII